MKHEPIVVQDGSLSRLDRIELEYAELLHSPSTSLQRLFETDKFRFADYGQGLQPHPQSTALQEIAQAFGRHYDIWLENAKHYITCTLFLYPMAPFDRMAAIVKNNAVDYFLNDTMGRDVFGFLPQAKQTLARKIVHRMASLDERLVVPQTAHPVEKANAEVLACIRDTSPHGWFTDFLKFYSYHLAVTHKDLNSSALGKISTVAEYINLRIHTAGMHHIILLIQYSTGNFLDWDRLGEIGLGYTLRRIHHLVAAFGALSNDLFSFEKEVIDTHSDSNLIMSIALNDPHLSLQEALQKAAEIVRDLLAEFAGLYQSIRRKITNLDSDISLRHELEIHLSGLEICLQASWLWQVYTRRYKRTASIWTETTI